MENKEASRERWYLETYNDFVNYFSDKQRLNRTELILGIAMVYSWMPKIPQTARITATEVNLVNEIINGKFSEKEELIKLEKLKKIVNNSMVGTSKLLHFIKPDKYPIWDSKVCKVFMEAEGISYKVDKIEDYLKYKDFCDEIINTKKFENIKKEVKMKIGLEKEEMKHLSNYRILDMYFFHFKSNKN